MFDNHPIKKKTNSDGRENSNPSESKHVGEQDSSHYGYNSLRQDAHENAAKRLEEIIPNLPKKFGNITVIDFGEINTGRMFHTPVKLYPIGYKGEVEIESSFLSPRGRGSSNSTTTVLLCEIMEIDDQPEFLLTVQSSGKVYISSTEEGVWRKFEGDNQLHNALSFFNLEVEVLLEGLRGALDCTQYMFHCERGYGESYTTDEQAALASSVFMSRQSRELRSRQRSSARHMSAEESKVVADAKKKQQKLDAEVKKRLVDEEKAEKEKERKQKEKQKELERIRKEAERDRKEKEKEMARREKEQQKKNDKARNFMRKDVMGDLRKARAEALTQVSQSFDQEEEEEELRRSAIGLHVGQESNGRVVSALDDLLTQLPTLRSTLGVDTSAQAEKIVDVVSLLYSLKGLLKIGNEFSFEYFVRDVLGNYPDESDSENEAPENEPNDTETDQIENTEKVESEDQAIGDAMEECEVIESAENDGIDQSAVVESKADYDITVDGTCTVPMEETPETACVSIIDPSAQAVGEDADEEAEADFSVAESKEGEEDMKSKKGRPGRPRKVKHQYQEERVQRQPSAVDLDRVQLNMLRVMLGNLHELFDLAESEGEGGSKKKGVGSSGAVTFPLNQLTWPELARMLIVLELNSDSEMTDDELMCSLRGSKQSLYKSSKNIIRYIRYRMAVRFFAKTADDYSMMDMTTAGSHTGRSAEELSGDIEDFLLRFALQPSCNSKNQSVEEDAQLFDFTSDAEITQAIHEIVENEQEYSEDYRRCCKVWLRVATLSQAKHLMWDVDPNEYPDYASVIRRQLSFSRVAYKLIRKSYGADSGTHTSSSTAEDAAPVIEHTDVGNGTSAIAATTHGDEPYTISAVAASFYRDMRQVLLNCFAFNTEAIAVTGHAQKLTQILHRHMTQWIFNPSAPPISACDDAHCLLSNEPIAVNSSEYTSIKCGRCNGVFSLSALESHRKELGTVIPTQEQLQSSQAEDWICPLCLQEDSLATEGHDGRERGVFSLDEWGPSALVPWQFNERHSALVESTALISPRVRYMVEALRVLSSPNITPVVLSEQRHLTRSAWAEQIQVPWTMNDRLNVFAALCEVLKGHSESNTYLNGIYNECVKLSKMSIREPFHEADFIDQVRKIAGNDGATLCLRLMDGMDKEAAQERVQVNQVIDGRCLVCRGSTFEDDYEGTILLCDGCNGEAHFTCLDLEKIPSKEWFCQPCSERMSHRYEDDGGSLEAQIKDLDSYRSKDEELRLMDVMATKRDGRQSLEPSTEILCEYCGQSELDICSPMVYGQSRAEFNAYVAMSEVPTADDVFPNKKDTLLKFCVLLEEVKAPEPKMPYFPLVKDPMSIKLKSRKSAAVQSPIVHELCALSMFKARMQRNKHEIRRRRRVVADRIASLSGMSTQPLGYDDSGRSYWQFPNSSSLFISPPHSLHDREPDCEALLSMIKPTGKAKKGGNKALAVVAQAGADTDDMEEANDVASDRGGEWVVVEDVLAIAKVIELLGRSAGEMSLRKSLSNYYAGDIEKLKREKEAAAAAATQVTSALTNGEADEIPADPSTLEGPKEEVPEPEDQKAVDEEAEQNGREEEGKGDDFSGKEYRTALPRKAAPVFAKAGEGKPVKMNLMLDKGVEMQSRYVIKQEKVFEDTGAEGDSDSENDEDDVSFQEYFVFSRSSSKYFAIALLDCYDKVCKMGKGATVVFEIKLDGVAQGLAYTPLEEPWTDGMYYFSTLNFRRSGKYTISFLVEGAKMGHIKPLVYPIVVEAENISCGPACALSRLRATDYITHADRHVVIKRRELMSEINRSESEFVAVKALLLTVYLALPMGAVLMGPEEEDKRNDMFGHIAEATGWNSNLDQTWRGCVLEAASPAMLMECLLVLEYYINKAWLTAPANKLLAALPNHHFAVRCVTNSSVALRIFCLDKCLAYDRIQNVPRGVRVTGDSTRATSMTGGTVSVAPPRKSRNNMNAKRSLEMSRGGYQEEVVETYSDRPKRGASLRARELMTASVKQFQDESDEERASRGRRSLRDRGPAKPQWNCHICTCLNEDRNRSCHMCGARRLSAEDAAASTSRMSRAERLQLRKKAYESSSEDDVEGEGDGDSEDETGRGKKRSSVSSSSASDRETALGLRKRARVSYAEKDDDDDQDDEDSDQEDDNAEEDQEEDENQEEQQQEEEEEIDLDLLISTRQQQLSPEQLDMDISLNLLFLLKKLADDPDSQHFWYPVDLQNYPDYSDKVSEPMDLGTIAKRVGISFYGDDHQDFARDVRLVTRNCRTYNADGSNISLCSERLEEYFDHLYADFVASLTKPRSSAKAASSEGVESSAAEDEGDDNESGANDEEAEEDGYDEEVDGEGHGGMSKDIMEVANGVE